MFHPSDTTTVALVWSFRNTDQSIPYRICCYQSSGGKKSWTCSCASFIYGGSRTCKHLIGLRKEAREGSLLADNRYKVSEFGMKLLKL